MLQADDRGVAHAAEAAMLEYVMHECVRLRLADASADNFGAERAERYLRLGEDILALFAAERAATGSTPPVDDTLRAVMAWAQLVDVLFYSTADGAGAESPGGETQPGARGDLLAAAPLLVRMEHTLGLPQSLAKDAAVQCAASMLALHAGDAERRVALEAAIFGGGDAACAFVGPELAAMDALLARAKLSAADFAAELRAALPSDASDQTPLLLRSAFPYAPFAHALRAHLRTRFAEAHAASAVRAYCSRALGRPLSAAGASPARSPGPHSEGTPHAQYKRARFASPLRAVSPSSVAVGSPRLVLDTQGTGLFAAPESPLESAQSSSRASPVHDQAPGCEQADELAIPGEAALPEEISALVAERAVIPPAEFRRVLVSDNDDELATVHDETHADLRGAAQRAFSSLAGIDTQAFAETQSPSACATVNRKSPGVKRGAPASSENDGHAQDTTPREKNGRVPWTPDEISNLVEGVERFGRRWRDILESYVFHPRRTNVDLKDKARNLNLG